MGTSLKSKNWCPLDPSCFWLRCRSYRGLALGWVRIQGVRFSFIASVPAQLKLLSVPPSGSWLGELIKAWNHLFFDWGRTPFLEVDSSHFLPPPHQNAWRAWIFGTNATDTFTDRTAQVCSWRARPESVGTAAVGSSEKVPRPVRCEIRVFVLYDLPPPALWHERYIMGACVCRRTPDHDKYPEQIGLENENFASYRIGEGQQLPAGLTEQNTYRLWQIPDEPLLGQLRRDAAHAAAAMQVPGAVPPPAVLGGVAAGVLAPAVPRVLRPLVEKAKEKQLSLMDQKSCAGQLVLS